MTRSFEDKPATRANGVPLLLGLMGPSGGGKTFSALRLATGMQRVTGGEVFVVDTETRRSLHYADRFSFRHVEFTPPFGSLDYLAAIEHCSSNGAKVIIVDSMSHEHEGPGGMLEQHESECDRLVEAWSKNRRVPREAVQMAAWAVPKASRRRMINTILQIPAHFIFCFRAKEKLKIVRGKDPEKLGFMPIAGEEFVYEMTANALLLPNANGVPTWQSDELGERQMIKRPAQFHDMLPAQGRQLDEDTGEAMARWAAGTVNRTFAELSEAIASADSMVTLEALAKRIKAELDAGSINKQETAKLREAFQSRKATTSATREPGSDDT